MQTDLTRQTGPVLFGHMRRTVLVVDDEPINREILGAILDESYEVMYAADGLEALEKVINNSETISAVLLDLIMPRMNGQGVIKRMHTDEKLRRIPIIVLTSEKSAEVESLNLGASDFIPKPYDAPEVILARVKRIIELSEDRTVIQAMERDYLTNLLTKNFFYEYSTVTKHFYAGQEMDAVVLNIDHFHLINELYGHELGNQVLQVIADTIYRYAREHEGTAARGDGDTFLLYLKRQPEYYTLLEQIEENLKAISDNLHAHLHLGVYNRAMDDQSETSAMFDRAMAACDTIRDNFQESVAYYDFRLQEDAIFHERLRHDMYEAIEQKQFMVHYQPKFDIRGDKPVLISAEALVRWKHPEFGIVSPGEFIPLFEENGQIQKVDHFVWEEAASQLRKWKNRYAKTVPISVNMSRIDAFDYELEQQIHDLIYDYNLKPSDLHLEITESACAQNTDRLVEVIETLRRSGFLIEMDDFGSGYSSLNMLSSMPIDVIKMDMRFIRNINKDSKQRKMVELVMNIASALSVTVVAEGVEDEEQYHFLKEIGCDIIQGYYFSKPLPAEEFEQYLIDYNKEDTI